MMCRSHCFAAVPGLLIWMLLLPGCGGMEAEVAGVYDLDRDAVRAAARADMESRRDAGEDLDEFAVGMALALFESMVMTLTLEADGAARMAMSMMGESATATGSWSLSGTTITITLAEEGRLPDTSTGTVDGERLLLRMPEADQMPFDFVFRKRPS